MFVSIADRPRGRSGQREGNTRLAHPLGPEVVHGQLGVVQLHHQPDMLHPGAQSLQDLRCSRMSVVIFSQQQSVLMHLHGKEKNENTSQWILHMMVKYCPCAQ